MKYFNALASFWKLHGTKVLGTAATIVAGAQAGALVLDDMLAPGTHKILAALNAALGVWTIKRGFSNSKSAEE